MSLARLLPIVALVPTLIAADPDPLKEIKFRQVGPFRGGRSVAVAGHVSQPFTYYFGSVGGGIFKTTDGGAKWEPAALHRSEAGPRNSHQSPRQSANWGHARNGGCGACQRL